MGNPARELYSIFEQWRSLPDKPAAIARGLHGQDTLEGAFDLHVRAMRLIGECEVALSELEQAGRNVATYRRTMRLWVSAVLHYPHSWQQGSSADPFTAHALDTLDGFALVLDAGAPLLNPGGVERLQDILQDASDLLDEDSDISLPLRRYMSEVIQRLRRLLGEDVVQTESDIEQAVASFWLALNAAAGQSNDENRGRWRKLAEDVLKPAAAGVLASLPGLALQGIGMLSSGH